MNIPYTVISEEESTLFERRIKLAELDILTITAIMVIMSFTRVLVLVWPVAIFSFDLILVILIIIFGSNRTRNLTHFGNNYVDASKKDISYKLFWQDIVAYIIYGLSTIITVYIILTSHYFA